MKKIAFFGLLAIGLFLSACGNAETPAETETPETAETVAPQPEAPKGYEDVKVAEFKAKMEGENVVILDVRTPEETAEGIIAGAIEIDVKDRTAFAAAVQELDKEKTYLVYCRSGNRSGKACAMMSEQGFSSLYNLDGGYRDWSKAHAAPEAAGE